MVKDFVSLIKSSVWACVYSMLINNDFRTCKLRMVSRLPVYWTEVGPFTTFRCWVVKDYVSLTKSCVWACVYSMVINTDFRTCKLRMVSRLPVYPSQTDIVYERPRALWVWNNWCLVHTNVHLATNIAVRMTWRSVTRWNRKGGWPIQQLCIVTWTFKFVS